MLELPDGQITVTEAQRISTYSRPQIYNLLRDKKVKASKYRFGGIRVFLIDRDSLIAYCTKRERAINGKDI